MNRPAGARPQVSLEVYEEVRFPRVICRGRATHAHSVCAVNLPRRLAAEWGNHKRSIDAISQRVVGRRMGAIKATTETGYSVSTPPAGCLDPPGTYKAAPGTTERQEGPSTTSL